MKNKTPQKQSYHLHPAVKTFQQIADLSCSREEAAVLRRLTLATFSARGVGFSLADVVIRWMLYMIGKISNTYHNVFIKKVIIDGSRHKFYKRKW